MRALGFSMLVIGNLWLIAMPGTAAFSLSKMNATRRRVILGTLLALMAMLLLPVTRDAFHFALPPWHWWGLLLGEALVLLMFSRLMQQRADALQHRWENV